MSVDEFLNKLPKQVIKNGQIINIRDDIGKDFFGKVDATADKVANNSVMNTKTQIKIKNGKEVGE